MLDSHTKPHSCSLSWGQAHLIMSSLALFLFLVLSLSLHACTRRPLSVAQQETARYHFDKGSDKVKMLETSTASRLKPSTIEEDQAKQQKAANDEINNNENFGSASPLKEEVIFEATSETRIATNSFQTDSLSSLITEEQRRHVRSMLGPAEHHVEKTVNPNPSDTVEDIVEIDYAQPHRKPPIHNEKP